jgi:anti-anti-sigma factor
VEIRQARLGDYFVFHANGRIDNQTSDAFQAELIAAVTGSAGDLIIDLSQVEYISSAGFRALMTAARRKAKDGRLAVVGLNDLLRELFAIARFHHVLPVFGSAEDAIAAWEAPAQPQQSAHAAVQDAAPLGIYFWGTRGSLPTPVGRQAVRAKVREALLAAREHGLPAADAVDAFIDRELAFSVSGTFGGNTACVEIKTGGDEYVLCDLGTGVREFGNRMLAQHGPGRKATYNVFMSHVHWDHIMGFPFFAPAYIPGNTIRIHGCHPVLRAALERQQSEPCFPVAFGSLGSTIEFVELEAGTEHQIAGLSVLPIKQFHDGDSYGYRFSRGGKSIVYSTDCEHKTVAIDASYPFVDFFRDADVLIFDAMYSLADTVSVKEDWGHSSNMIAVELAQMAKAKRLVLFHHEPAYDDRTIERVLADTIRFEEISRAGHKVDVMSAYDGLELTI